MFGAEGRRHEVGAWRSGGGGLLVDSQSRVLSRDGSPSGPQDYNAVRWLEYSGVLVVLGILTDAAEDGLLVTEIASATRLCNETVYSALSVAANLGLVWLQILGQGVPVYKRYRLTEAGLRLGRLAQQARDELRGLPAPPHRGGRE